MTGRPASIFTALLLAVALHPARAVAQPPAPTHPDLVYAVLGGRPLRRAKRHYLAACR